MEKITNFIRLAYKLTLGKLEIHTRIGVVSILLLLLLNIVLSLKNGNLFGSRNITSEWKLKNTLGHLTRFKSYHDPEPVVNYDGYLMTISSFKIDISRLKIYLDENTIKEKFNEKKEISDSLAIDYIDSVNNQISTIEYQIKLIEDSLNEIKEKKDKNILIAQEKKFYKTKAGRIHKKHPDWSREDCERLANRKIWIGMHIDMVKYLRGLPNHVSTSNYGYGNNYQMCWDDYNPSCFYCESDGIVTSYN